MIGLATALLLLVIGAGQTVFGVYLLAGSGWAMLALGLFTIAAGVISARGIS